MMSTIIKKETGLYETSLGDLDSKGNDALIQIGGKNKFAPKVKMSKWNEEVHFDMELKNLVVTKDEEFDGEKIKIKEGDITQHWFNKGDNVLEWEIIFDSNPLISELVFDLDFSKDLEFFYQDTLENDFITEGPSSEWPTLGEYLANTHRPENVVGSYVVQWKEENGIYKTGKFCHIYRFQCIDAFGKTEWCAPLEIKNKKLTIKLPLDFLASATYPIICRGAGDTLGYDSIGGSSSSTSNLNGFQYTMPGSNGTATDYYLYSNADESGTNWKAGIYSDNGSTYPDALLANTGSAAGPGAAGWASQSISYNLVANTIYWIAFDVSDSWTYKYNSGGVRRHIAFAWNGLPNPFTGGASSSTRKLSTYVEYTAGGVVAPTGALDGPLVGPLGGPI